MTTRVTPKKPGEYTVKVTAEATNPYSAGPAYQADLKLVVEK